MSGLEWGMLTKMLFINCSIIGGFCPFLPMKCSENLGTQRNMWFSSICAQNHSKPVFLVRVMFDVPKDWCFLAVGRREPLHSQRFWHYVAKGQVTGQGSWWDALPLREDELGGWGRPILLPWPWAMGYHTAILFLPILLADGILPVSPHGKRKWQEHWKSCSVVSYFFLAFWPT